MKQTRTLGVALLATVFGAGTALASTIQVTLASVVANGSVYDWNYRAELTANSQIDGQSVASPNPATLVIYDFAGYDSYAGGNPAWLFNTQLVVGPPVFLQAAPDDPATLNAVFRYDAANNPTIDNVEGGSILPLGTFTLRSSYGFTSFVSGFYSSEDTREINEAANTLAPGGHTSEIQVPSATPVPEPASLVLLGLGLLGLAPKLRRG